MPGPVQVNLDLGHRQLERFGDLLVAHAFDVAQLHHEALLFRELVDELLDLCQSVVLFGSFVRPGFGVGQRQCVADLGGVAELFPQLVDRQVFGDANSPGFHVLYFGQGFAAAPELDKDLLHDIFCLRAVADHAEGKAKQLVFDRQDPVLKFSEAHAAVR